MHGFEIIVIAETLRRRRGHARDTARR